MNRSISRKNLLARFIILTLLYALFLLYLVIAELLKLPKGEHWSFLHGINVVIFGYERMGALITLLVIGTALYGLFLVRFGSGGLASHGTVSPIIRRIADEGIPRIIVLGLKRRITRRIRTGLLLSGLALTVVFLVMFLSGGNILLRESIILTRILDPDDPEYAYRVADRYRGIGFRKNIVLQWLKRGGWDYKFLEEHGAFAMPVSMTGFDREGWIESMASVTGDLERAGASVVVIQRPFALDSASEARLNGLFSQHPRVVFAMLPSMGQREIFDSGPRLLHSWMPLPAASFGIITLRGEGEPYASPDFQTSVPFAYRSARGDTIPDVMVEIVKKFKQVSEPVRLSTNGKEVVLGDLKIPVDEGGVTLHLGRLRRFGAPVDVKIDRTSLRARYLWNSDRDTTSRIGDFVRGRIVIIYPEEHFWSIGWTPTPMPNPMRDYAAVVNDLLDGRVYRIDTRWSLLLAGLAIAVSAIASWWLRFRYALPLLILVACGIVVYTEEIFTTQHTVVPVLYPLTGLTMSYVLFVLAKVALRGSEEGE